MRKKIVIVLGPTASGKSELAIELALAYGGEIISADSMQVFRFMDVGTAKPSKDDLLRVPHHLIDVADPAEEFTAARFRREAAALIDDIASRGRRVFVAGGTGLYIKALTQGIFEGPQADQHLRRALLEEAEVSGRGTLHGRLKEVDPESAARIHPNNLHRIIRALEVYELSRRPISDFQKEHAFNEAPYETLKVGLMKQREELYRDIDLRVDKMMEKGLLGETERLLKAGYDSGLKPLQGLGYKEMRGHLNGEYPLEEAVRLLKRNTRHYAKRQMTWFRKDPEIRWFHPADKSGIMALVKEFLR